MADPFSPERTENVEQTTPEVKSEYLETQDETAEPISEENEQFIDFDDIQDASFEEEMPSMNEEEEMDLPDWTEDSEMTSESNGLWENLGDAFENVMDDISADIGGETGSSANEFGSWDVRNAGTFDLT